MEILPWGFCSGDSAVEILPWGLCSGDSAVEILPWGFCSGDSAVEIPQKRFLSFYNHKILILVKLDMKAKKPGTRLNCTL